MNKAGLLVRLAVVIVFSALAVGFIFGQIFYRITYLQEVEVSDKEISQLFQTVSATAEIAAYLGDSELAKEVINGLATNGIVDGATLETDTLNVQTKEIEREKAQVFLLYSPFEKEKKVWCHNRNC